MTPRVSVIVPCYNEEKTIGLLLEAVCTQTWPLDEMEVLIADGCSTDRTREVIAKFQKDHAGLAVRVVENLRRNIPAGLNAALAEANGEIIVRLDAHSEPATDYVERCVTDLEAGLGENVGGIWQIRPGGRGWVARSIAQAAAHPLGVGDALYRYTNRAAEVDTVPFGAFRMGLIDRIGKFDETLLTNEDYEFNTRIRRAGGKIWLDPAIRSVYYARASLKSLAKQYWRYGFWKYRMLRRYPATLRWRQALPPLFVLGLAGLAILSLFWILARTLLCLVTGVYVLALIAGSIPVALRERDLLLALGMPLAIGAMHLAWGAGFLVSMVQSLFGEPAGSG